MGSLSSIADRVRQSASDLAFEAKVMHESGILGVSRPDRSIRSAATLVRWGASPATGIATAAIKHPDAPAIVDERGSLTFEEVHRRSNALAHALAKMGIGFGDGVGVMCRNHRGFIEVTLAAAKLGASALYLNTMFAGPQLVEVTRREGPKVLVHDEEFAGLLDGVDESVIRVIGWTDGDAEGPTLDSLIAENDDSNLKPPPDKPRFVILTSGTTGTPKGAQRSSPDGLLAVAAIIDKISYRGRETMVVAAPLFHSWGFFHFLISLPTASTLVLRRRFDPEETLKAVQEHRAEVLAVVPVMLQRIMQLPEETLAKYRLPSLRITALSGSALPGELALAWMDRFGDSIYNLYGSTEVSWATVATPEDLRAAPGTAGRPPRGTVIKLYDEAGREVPRGEVGRIFVGNEMAFEGYTGGGGKEVIDGLFSSGDVGHFDPAGRLFIDGRDDEMIVSGGENVFPREVEDLLADHEAVVEVAVIGVEDEEFGQRLKAFVVLEEGDAVGEDELKAHVKANLASYKTPREVEFLDELPRNATGKVLKRDLHAREAETFGLIRPIARPESESPANCVNFDRGQGGVPSGARSSLRRVSAEGARVHLEEVTEATDQVRGIAKQALEWVRVSEARVGEAEQRAAEAEQQAEQLVADAELRVKRAEESGGEAAARVQAELKQRAMEILKKLGEEGRERIAAERERRVQAESRAGAAEQARDRAEQAFEQERRRDQADREALATEMIALKERSEEERLALVKNVEAESQLRLREALEGVQSDANVRIAAAEQRAAEAEAAAEEARAIAVKIESEIEERVMQGTTDVRREAEQRVRELVEKFEGEAEELARNRAKDQLQAESDRIRKQAEQREERARRTAEEEIKASASRARREAIAAAEETAPSWAPRSDQPESPITGYRTF